MRTKTRPASPPAPEPQYRPAQAWPDMPPIAPPITLSEPGLGAQAPEPTKTGLDPGTVREVLALALLLAGTAAGTAAAFLVAVTVGLAVLGALLLGLGVLLAVTE